MISGERESDLAARLDSGEAVKLGEDPAGQVSVKQVESWSSERDISAELLVNLLTRKSAEDDAKPRFRPLRLAGARIRGSLNLEGATLVRSVVLTGCYFDEPLILREARAQSIGLPGCCVPGLDGDDLHLEGDLTLNGGFTSDGEVLLRGARVGGTLDCEDGNFLHQSGVSLNANGISVGIALLCRQRFLARGEVTLILATAKLFECTGATFENEGAIALNADGLQADAALCRELTAKGEVRLVAANIKTNLELNGGRITNNAGIALNLEGLKTGNDLMLREGFIAKGAGRAVSLIGARVGGILYCDDGTFESEGGAAINADGLRVDVAMLGRGLTAKGEVRLLAANINSNLELDGSRFENEDRVAIDAGGIQVQGAMLCRWGFRAHGEVRLIAARIARGLECDGATFENKTGIALNGDKVRIDLALFMRNQYVARGRVRLGLAQINGDMDCSNALFDNDGDVAIDAFGLRVNGNIFCNGTFDARGEFRLTSAQVGGRLECYDATFSNPGNVAVNLERASISGPVYLRPKSLKGALNLSYAHVGALYDDARRWPSIIGLDGFEYDVIEAEPRISTDKRLEWLELNDGGYSPQPYERLAAVYRRVGLDRPARDVLVRKQWVRRASTPGRWGWLQRLWSVFLWATVGYGYRPWLVLFPLTALFAGGWIVFDLAHQHDDIVLANPDRPHPSFHAARYTLDLLLPVANLKQRDFFTALGVTSWYAFLFSIAGWLLALVLVAALTGIFRRD
jgi:hypothetical protein